MKVNLKPLIRGTLKLEEFYLNEAGREGFLSDMGGRFLTPIKVHLIMENTGKKLAGRARVSTILALNCGRCLEEFEYPLLFELILAAAEISAYEDNGEMLLIEDEQADIMPRVEEEIFSLIPLNPLCRQDCRGLCPSCGINKNQQSCTCKENDLDPRWQKLKELKMK